MLRGPFAGECGGAVRSAGGVCVACARLCLRVCTVAALLALIAGGIVYARLLEGPLPIPGVAAIAERMANDASPAARVEIGEAVIALGRRGAPTGLRFREVRAVAPDGTVLLEAPSLSARFSPQALLRGELRPTHVRLIGPRARVVRGRDGRIRVGLGRGAGLPLGETAPDATRDAQAADAVAEIVQGFVGDAEPIEALALLRRVAILDADLTYEDAATGRRWRTRGSTLRLRRTPTGAEAHMDATVDEALSDPIVVRIDAARAAGTGATRFSGRIGPVRPATLVEHLPLPGGLAGIEVPVTAEIAGSVDDRGGLDDLAGRIEAAAGHLTLGGATRRLDRARLEFEAGEAPGEIRVTSLEIEGPALALSARGRAGIGADRPLRADLWAEDIRVRAPEFFPDPLAFEGGALSLSLDPGAPMRVTLAEAALWRGQMALGASGEITLGDDGGVTADLRATGRGLTIADLKSHWPAGAAPGARDWVRENMIAGRIPELLTQLRLRPGEEPGLALDFAFEGTSSGYLGDMPPIEAGRGHGHLSADEFHLRLEEGEVRAGDGPPIRLLPSTVAITAFAGTVTPADITILAEGRSADILSLIDREPLGLVSKIGLDPRSVGGRARVRANLAFPLIDDLPLESVAVETSAALSDVAMTIEADGTPVSVTAEALSLDATAEEMEVSGRAEVEGTPLTVDWRETFSGPQAGRRIVLSGAITPELLAARGVALPGFAGGRADAEVVIEQRGGPAEVDLEADLAGARLEVAPLRWSKPAGEAGRLAVSARLGEATEIGRISLSAGELAIEGEARLGPDGDLERARFSRVALGQTADLVVEADRAADGALDLRVTGARLDISDYVTEPAEEETAGRTPIRLDAEIDRVVLTPKIFVAPARGLLVRNRAGEISLDLSGQAGGRAPFEAVYTRSSGRPGAVSLSSGDAGALLSALGFFQGGRGGTLSLDARLKPEAGTDVAGTAVIDDMTVQRADTFGSILEEGGAAEAAEAVQSGGLSFSSIEIPFRYADGRLVLDEAIARSPLLAVKVDGEVEETANRVALRGVMSPAYAVTGALDSIPVLGDILSGGQGEGIFAMTFAVTGTLDDPAFTVNPLSILAPGVLRRLFAAAPGAASEDFLENLDPGRDR